MFTGMGDPFIALPEHAAAKISMPDVPVDIAVGDSTPRIDAKAAFWVLRDHPFVPAEGIVWYANAFPRFISAQDGYAGVRPANQCEVERHPYWMGQYSGSGNDCQIVGGCLSGIFNFYAKCHIDSIFRAFEFDVSYLSNDISSQTLFGGVLGFFDERPSGPPQSESEQHKHSIGNLQSPVQEGNGPVLGGLLTAMAGTVIASACYGRFRILPILLAFMSTVGLLFGFDLWTLGCLIWRAS